MFGWLGVALFVDAVDGALARRFKVTETAPFIDGVALDLVVDFLNYVVTPLVALWRSGLLEPVLRRGCLRLGLRLFGALFRRSADEDVGLLVSRIPGALERRRVLSSCAAGACEREPRACPDGDRAHVRAGRLHSSAARQALAPRDDRRHRHLGRGGDRGGRQNLAAASFGVKAVLVATGCYFLALPLLRKGGAIAKGEIDG